MYIVGTSTSEFLTGTDQDDVILGGAGADTLDGGLGNDELDGGPGNDSYVIRDRFDHVVDSDGIDSAVIYVDFYKTNSSVENWTWASGVQRLPYWLDALLPGASTGFPALVGSAKTIYYCFPSSAPAYFHNSDAAGFEGFNAQQKAFARQALDYIVSVVNLRFVETNDPNQTNTIVFGNNIQTGSSAYAYYPSGSFTGSDVLMNADQDNLNPAVGKESALILMHELGHALGLKHPFIGGGSNEGPSLPSYQDWSELTVMSYETYPYVYDLSYAPLDIAALQYLYGPSAAIVRDDVYTVDPYKPNFIWDGAGTDTIDASALSQNVALYLEPGYWGYIGSKATQIYAGGQVTVNFGTVIENAKGGKAGDIIVGNSADNQIWGGGGDDIISAGAGNDFIDAGEGNDTVKGLSGHATILGGHGEDRLFLQQAAAEMKVIKLSADAFIVTDAAGSNLALCRDVELLHFSDSTVALADIPVAQGINTEVEQLYLANVNVGATALASLIDQVKNANGTIIGNASNNRIIGGNGSDSVDGGVGLDTFVVGASRSAFTVSKSSNTVAITDIAGMFGSDSLVNVERVEFNDAAIAFDIDGNAGMAYRLYQAAFDRAPDLPGLGFWIKALDDGLSLLNVAAGFYNSAEFGTLYGTSLTNAQLITEFYDNVLHRAPDAEGFKGWLDVLDRGLASREQVLIEFSESAENKAQLIGAIQNGIEYIPYL
ncbi:MAG TPA: DUF4214 domain-containing protein [Noviherbaspirillum sp.]|nr:DUF4214 domain-containing protein [Noviherbaspirillum sp.]